MGGFRWEGLGQLGVKVTPPNSASMWREVFIKVGLKQAANLNMRAPPSSPTIQPASPTRGGCLRALHGQGDLQGTQERQGNNPHEIPENQKRDHEGSPHPKGTIHMLG